MLTEYFVEHEVPYVSFIYGQFYIPVNQVLAILKKELKEYLLLFEYNNLDHVLNKPWHYCKKV